MTITLNRTVTVEEILTAIDKNGLTPIHGQWEDFAQDERGNSKLVGGCALTQAAHNLGVVNEYGGDGRALFDKLIDLHVHIPDGKLASGLKLTDTNIGELIISLNDTPKSPNDTSPGYRTLSEITEYVRETIPEVLTQTVNI